MEYDKSIEHIADKSHEGWIHWSTVTANALKEAVMLMKSKEPSDHVQAIKILEHKLEKWKKSWIPYNELTEEMKEFDREWAQKLVDYVPTKCPVYQCGGLMAHEEQDPPDGGTPDEYGDGYPGDDQRPDLVCTNCRARYIFHEFRKDRSKQDS